MSDNAALEVSAKIMYMTLNGVYKLHDVVEFETGEDKTVVEGCDHCTEMANINNPDEENLTVIKYPCPTVSILLADMVDAPVTEEIPAE